MAVKRLIAKVAATGLVGLLLALTVWRLTHQSPPPKPGKPAPSFRLSMISTRGRLSLRQFEGKVVVLNFWSSSCEPCRKEMSALESLYQRYRSRGLIVIGIDPEDFRGQARKFLEARAVTYPNVLDTSYAVTGAYAVAATPETFVIDRRGFLVGRPILGSIQDPENQRALVPAITKLLDA